jgi:hypothetical protein
MNQPGNYFAIAAVGNCAFFEALREAKVISGRSIRNQERDEYTIVATSEPNAITINEEV